MMDVPRRDTTPEPNASHGSLPVSDALAAIRSIHAQRPYSRSLLASGLLHDEVEWLAAGSPAELPWACRHVGPEGVKRFFHLLAESMTYEGFDMQHVVADASTVVAIIEAWGFAKATGRTFRGTIVRIYAFRDGKIVKVQNIYDTAAYVAALRAA